MTNDCATIVNDWSGIIKATILRCLFAFARLDDVTQRSHHVCWVSFGWRTKATLSRLPKMMMKGCCTFIVSRNLRWVLVGWRLGSASDWVYFGSQKRWYSFGTAKQSEKQIKTMDQLWVIILNRIILGLLWFGSAMMVYAMAKVWCTSRRHIRDARVLVGKGIPGIASAISF